MANLRVSVSPLKLRGMVGGERERERCIRFFSPFSGGGGGFWKKLCFPFPAVSSKTRHRRGLLLLPPPPSSARVRMMKWEGRGGGGGKTVPPHTVASPPGRGFTRASCVCTCIKNILQHETHDLAQNSLEYIRKSFGSKSIVLSIGSSCKRKGEEEEEPAALSSGKKRASCLS